MRTKGIVSPLWNTLGQLQRRLGESLCSPPEPVALMTIEKMLDTRLHLPVTHGKCLYKCILLPTKRSFSTDSVHHIVFSRVLQRGMDVVFFMSSVVMETYNQDFFLSSNASFLLNDLPHLEHLFTLTSWIYFTSPNAKFQREICKQSAEL